LALYGFAPSGRYRIADAVERELSRLLGERDVSPLLTKGTEMARLDGEPFQMPSGSKAETIGAQVAQAVYEGMMR